MVVQYFMASLVGTVCGAVLAGLGYIFGIRDAALNTLGVVGFVAGGSFYAYAMWKWGLDADS